MTADVRPGASATQRETSDDGWKCPDCGRRYLPAFDCQECGVASPAKQPASVADRRHWAAKEAGLSGSRLRVLEAIASEPRRFKPIGLATGLALPHVAREARLLIERGYAWRAAEPGAPLVITPAGRRVLAELRRAA